MSLCKTEKIWSTSTKNLVNI